MRRTVFISIIIIERFHDTAPNQKVRPDRNSTSKLIFRSNFTQFTQLPRGFLLIYNNPDSGFQSDTMYTHKHLYGAYSFLQQLYSTQFYDFSYHFRYLNRFCVI